jgi:5'-3' exonuclease
VAEALGFAVFERESFEGDDLLATLSSHVVRRRGRAVVYSSDKDLCQLVREDGSIVVHDLARERTSDADGVRERFGVDPAQIPDFLGLVGDSVDNLPGVPGVGPRTAAVLLQAFGSIESIPLAPEAWAELPVRGARRLARLVAEHRERALLTKRLAQVRHDVPDLAPGLAELRQRGASPAAVTSLFDRLGWDRIRSRIPRWRREA